MHFVFSAPKSTCNFKSLFELSKLNYLDSSCNSISFIPQEIKTLLNLKFLNLARNHIQILPDTIGCLVDLEYLNLSSNPIRVLPDTLNYLTKLRELDLCFLNLKPIPANIFSALINLKNLYLPSELTRTFIPISI